MPKASAAFLPFSGLEARMPTTGRFRRRRASMCTGPIKPVPTTAAPSEDTGQSPQGLLRNASGVTHQPQTREQRTPGAGKVSELFRRTDVVAQQLVLRANIEPAAEHYRVRPA